jgi:hypothetical protein
MPRRIAQGKSRLVFRLHEDLSIFINHDGAERVLPGGARMDRQGDAPAQVAKISLGI